MAVRVFLVFILMTLAAPAADGFAQTGPSEIRLLGLELSEATDELRRKYRIAPGTPGIVITGVDSARNAAERFGGAFVPGEVITAASVYLAGLRELTRPEDLLSVIEQSRREYRNSLAVLVANVEGHKTWRHLPIANYDPSKVVRLNTEQPAKTQQAATSCTDPTCMDVYSECVKDLKDGESDSACRNKTLECRAHCQRHVDSPALTTGSLPKASQPAELSRSNEAASRQEVGAAVSGPGWLDTNKPNCKVWNLAPQVTESVTWSGGCRDGRADGEGHLVWQYVKDGVANAQIYEGQLKDGKLHGQGVFTHADGDRYEGAFKDGRKHGQGVFIYADGDRYEGEFKAGKRHGLGVFTYAGGDRYEGQWTDGNRHGRGVYTYADGDRVEGEFKDGEATGSARFAGARGTAEIIYFTDGCGETKNFRICLQ